MQALSPDFRIIGFWLFIVVTRRGIQLLLEDTQLSKTFDQMDQIGKSSPRRPEVVCPRSANEKASGSITTRIRHSASGLISNPFSRPSPSSVVSSLPCFPDEGSKGESIFVSTNSSGLGSSSMHQSSRYSSIYFDQQRGRNVKTELQTSQSRKNCGNNKTCQSAFEEFMFQEAPCLQLQHDLNALSEIQGNISYHDPKKLWVRDGKSCGAAPPKLASVWSQDTIRAAPDIYLDGAAVVAILCDPEFSPDGGLEHLTRCPTEDIEEIRDDMLQVCPLADLQESSTVPASSTVDLDSNVNEKLSIAMGGVSQETIWIEPIRSCDPMAADGELHFWLKNFKNYQDEVWGNMSYPALKPREEKVGRGHGHETVWKHIATKRLAMIVGHINLTIKRR